MKVLGKTGDRHDGEFICQISTSELKKYFNTYYNERYEERTGIKISDLKTGDELDLGRGYDFAADTKRALEKTQEFIEAHDKTIKAIVNGIKVMGTHEEEES